MPEPTVQIDLPQYRLLEAIERATSELVLPWILTGGGGRVLLLEKQMGLAPGKATQDLDFGVMVGSWDEFEALKSRICQDARFHPDARLTQRVWCSEEAKLDLIPFGAIAYPDDTFRWPEEDGPSMSVLGFQEAYDSAIRLRVNGRLTVPVASPPAMLLLKFLAWEDRHTHCPGRDALDIAYILRHGVAIVGQDTLYERYATATEAADWDLDLAASRVLGTQVASMAMPRTKQRLSGMLEREVAQREDSSLVLDVAAGLPCGRVETTRAFALLNHVLEGMKGERGKVMDWQIVGGQASRPASRCPRFCSQDRN